MNPAQNTVLPGPWAALRPLSDIKETTEPSLLDADLARRRSARKKRGKHVSIDLTRNPSLKANGPPIARGPSQRSNAGCNHTRLEDHYPTDGADATGPAGPPASSPESETDRSSGYSVSLETVPRRTRSRSRSRHTAARSSHSGSGSSSSGGRRRDSSAKGILGNHQPAQWLDGQARPPGPHSFGYAAPHHGAPDSPVKDVASRIGNPRPARGRGQQRRHGAAAAAVPKTRTLVRTRDPNTDVLEFPAHRHPCLSVALQLGANLFVGGGSIEGHVRVVVADEHAERARRPPRRLAIGRLSVDLLGVEEQLAGGGGGGPKRSVFINLTTEILDADNPPPRGMVESPRQISSLDPFWLLAAGATNVPFLLSLPLDVGPPPFQSKHARIRYVLGVTVLMRDQGKQYPVRTSRDVAVISVYDRKFRTFGSNVVTEHRDCS
jgi:hypothetical protein